MQIAKKQYQDNDLLNIEEVCELIGGIVVKLLQIGIIHTDIERFYPLSVLLVK